MKKCFILFSLLFINILGYAQTPLVDISFDAGGPVNNGQFDQPMTSFDAAYTSSRYNPIKKTYMGCTSRDSRGFYYMLYNAEDALGKAFSTAATWELLFRLDAQICSSYSGSADSNTGTGKIFSCQESGGWSLYTYPSYGIRFQYVTNSHTITAQPNFKLETGKFYHVVVTVDHSTKLLNMYVNGQKLVTDLAIDDSEYKAPNIGTTRRQTNMWWCLGGDPSSSDEPTRAANSTQTSFVNARIYGTALTEDKVKELYNTDDVKYYTEPEVTNKNQIILDALFNADGAEDMSNFSKNTQRLTEMGTVLTEYNEEQKRYQTISDKTAGNYFRRDYWYDPLITSELSENFAYEVYAKSNSAEPSAYLSPLSAQQSGGLGFEITTEGAVKFNPNVYAYHASTSSLVSNPAHVATGAGTLTTEWTHYVVSFDRKAGKSSIYINGTLAASKNLTNEDMLTFCYAPYQWFAVAGDTRSSDVTCDYPFDGNISIARVWDKGLTEADAKELYSQAKSTSRTVTIGASGYAAVCVPFPTEIPTGLKAYIISAVTDTEVTLALLANAGSVIAYGTPVILAGEAGTYTLSAKDTRGVKVITATTNLLEGTFIDMDITAGNAFTLASNGTLTSEATTVKATGAYLPTSGTGTKTIKVDGTAASTTYTQLSTNITGKVTCSGVGVKDVVVSDGFVVTTTDENGNYAFYSEKKNGYVFISLPSGYEIYENYKTTAGEKIFTPFWQPLKYTKNKSEEHNFKLRVKNTDNHYMLVGADTHISTEASKTQFYKYFISAVKKEAENAGATPIYSTILGDLTCNYHWYRYDFYPASFYSLMETDGYPFKLFPVMGNHDHDSKVDDGLNSDFDASARYRTTFGPNYYSYNLGKVHYVVLDDTYFLNTHTPGKTYSYASGEQDYYNYVDDYQLEWLKKDLQYVDKNTPVIIGAHIPVYGISQSTFQATNNLTNGGNNCTVALSEIVKDFKTVHIITGHTHYNYHVHPTAYPNIHENNIAAVCAIWWASEPLSGRHNCRDGSPGGYEFFTVKGTDISWQYHSLEADNNSQFHAVDMNPVKAAYQTDPIIAGVTEYSKNGSADWSATRKDYSTFDDNCLLLNVYNYDIDWKIEVTENGKKLSAVRGSYEDPVHYMCYDYPQYKKNKTISRDSRAGLTTHIFKIQCETPDADVDIKVTDPFGNIYKETIHRPMTWDATIMGHNETILTGVDNAFKAGEKASVYVKDGAICIEATTPSVAKIVSVDGKVFTRNLSAGHNTISMPQGGVYIVTANGKTTKMFVK